MLQSTVTQRDLRKLKGKVLNDFSYSVTYKNFVKSAKFKNVKTIAFGLGLLSMTLGLLLPLIVGFCASLKDLGTDFFQVNMISNSIFAIVFCLPLSLAFIIGAVPLYNKIISLTLSKYGFSFVPRKLSKEIA
jgi:hypothetical protein